MSGIRKGMKSNVKPKAKKKKKDAVFRDYYTVCANCGYHFLNFKINGEKSTICHKCVEL